MDKWLKPYLAYLFNNKKFSDCRILVGNESFDCHRIILASSSEFFERLFLSSFSDSVSGEFRLQDVKPEIFAKFIEYVYTYNQQTLKECSLSIIMELLICGNRWLVKSIVHDCVMIIKLRAGDMSLTDLIKLFQISCDINNIELKNIIVKRMRNIIPKYIGNSSVLYLSSEVFEQYIIMTQNFVDEVQRFKIIEYYVTANGLIDDDPAETPYVVEDKREGDCVTGQMVAPVKSSDDDDQEISEIKDQESDDNGKDAAENPGMGKPNTKIKGQHSNYVRTLLGHLNFNWMNKNDFYNTVGQSNLLTDKEKYEYLYVTKS